MDYTLHGILQAFPFSRGSSQPRDWTQVSSIAGGYFTVWATREAPCTRSVQFSYSFMSDSFATPWTAACQASLSITNSQTLLKLMSIESVMPSNHLILCRPLLLPPSTFPSIRVFSNELVLCMRWPKCWHFCLSIRPSNEYSGLISFRMDCLDLCAVQGNLKSILPHHSSKASILWHWAFSIVQLSHPYQRRQWQPNVLAWRILGKAEPGGLLSLGSHRVRHDWSDLAAAAAHPYMTTGKSIDLTRKTFVGKVMSLPFNMLSKFVITFLPRSELFF